MLKKIYKTGTYEVNWATSLGFVDSLIIRKKVFVVIDTGYKLKKIKWKKLSKSEKKEIFGVMQRFYKANR